MFAAGFNVKEVQEILGHAKASITLDRYTHLLRSSTHDRIAELAAYRQRQRQRQQGTDEERAAQ